MGFKHNPAIQEKDLQKLHQASSHWALFCCNFNHELAKDVLQQCYLKIVEGKAVYNQESSLKTWLFSVVRLTAYELNRPSAIKLIDLGHKFDELLHSIEDENLPSQNLYDEKEIDKALRQLSVLHREIIFLSFYGENSLSEIARILNISIGSARSEYHHAKVKLKVLLSDYKEGVIYEEKYS